MTTIELPLLSRNIPPTIAAISDLSPLPQLLLATRSPHLSGRNRDLLITVFPLNWNQIVLHFF